MAIKVSDDIARALAESGGYIQKQNGKMTTVIVDPDNPKAVADAKADIKKRHAEMASAKAKANSKPKNPWAARNNTRVREFEKLFQQRYRGVLPDEDDSARSDLIPAIRHILATESEENARRFAESWAPWCTGPRFDEIAEEIGPNPTPQKAKELGEELGLTYALRKYLGIHTIGPSDVTQRQFTQLKKEEDAERKRFERLLKGGMPRQIYESFSKAKTEPWKVMGWSERTYYRRVEKLGQAAVDAMIADAAAKSGRGPSGVNLQSLRRTHFCQLTDAAQRLRGIMPDQNVLVGASPAVGNPQAGVASNDNLPPPAEWETPTQVAA